MAADGSAVFIGSLAINDGSSGPRTPPRSSVPGRSINSGCGSMMGASDTSGVLRPSTFRDLNAYSRHFFASML